MELDCGIAYQRIASWLDDELSLPYENGTWTFAFNGKACQVKAAPLPSRTLGKFGLERTQVAIGGDPTALDEFYRLFTLRFISAGG